MKYIWNWSINYKNRHLFRIEPFLFLSCTNSFTSLLQSKGHFFKKPLLLTIIFWITKKNEKNLPSEYSTVFHSLFSYKKTDWIHNPTSIKISPKLKRNRIASNLNKNCLLQIWALTAYFRMDRKSQIKNCFSSYSKRYPWTQT